MRKRTVLRWLSSFVAVVLAAGLILPSLHAQSALRGYIVTFDESVTDRATMEAIIHPPGSPGDPPHVVKHLVLSNALVVELSESEAALLAAQAGTNGILFVSENKAVRQPSVDLETLGGDPPPAVLDGGQNDLPPLQVLGSTPANNTQDAVPGSSLVFHFNDSVDRATVVNGSTFIVRKNGFPVTGGSFQWFVGLSNRPDDTLRYLPPAPHWEGGASYTVRLTSGIRGARRPVGALTEYNIAFTGAPADRTGFVSAALRQVSGFHPQLSGEGVKVAVIDSGYDRNHPDKPVSLHTGMNFIVDPPSTDDQDDLGHGTAVIGVIAGDHNPRGGRYSVAPKASIYPLKVLSSSGFATTGDLTEAVHWCRDNGMHVVNISLVGFPDNPGLNAALQQAYTAGVLLVASAGNIASGVVRPALHPEVMAIPSSLNPDNTMSHFSCFGPDIELIAPGNWVYTSKMGGGYINASGTSFASPISAGVAALYKQAYPADTVSQLRTRVKLNADNLFLPATQQGSGRADCTEQD